MDNIIITLPKKSEYISTLRLTTSSIASKIEFNIDSLEDIKMLISETCIFLIKNFEENEKPLEIKYTLKEKGIEISIIDKNIENIEVDEEDMSIMIVKSLSDKVEIKDNRVTITKNIFL
ncbi:MAG: histidine kinase [Bacillota bacterium]|nr:histidine kinase [Bacillota bacterium]